MPHPIEKALFIVVFACWFAWWIDSHTIRVSTSVDHTGATTTVVDLVCDEVEVTPTQSAAPTQTP